MKLKWFCCILYLTFAINCDTPCTHASALYIEYSLSALANQRARTRDLLSHPAHINIRLPPILVRLLQTTRWLRHISYSHWSGTELLFLMYCIYWLFACIVLIHYELHCGFIKDVLGVMERILEFVSFCLAQGNRLDLSYVMSRMRSSHEDLA